jgi:polyadenylate-binding protein
MTATAASIIAPATMMAPTGPTRPASLFIADVPQDLNDVDNALVSHFSKIGPVTSVKVCRDIATGRILGHAYVNFQDPANADAAVKQLNYSEIVPGREIRVSWSQRDPSQRKANIGNVIVKHLGDEVTGRMLHDTFAALAPVVSVKVSRTESGKSRHYGFVQFESQEGAEKAIKLSADKKLVVADKVVVVEIFKRRAEREKEQMESFKSLFVKNLKSDVTEEELSAIFKPFGGAASTFIGRSDKFETSWAVVTMNSHEDAVKAIAELHEKASPIVATSEKEEAPLTLFVQRLQSKSERAAQYKASSPHQLVQNGGRNVYVKHLPENTTEESLRELFGKYGTITAAKPVMDAATKTFRGFAFVVFETPEAATMAQRELHRTLHHGRPLYVSIAQPKDARHRLMEQHARQRRMAGPVMSAFYPPPMGMFPAPAGGRPSGPRGAQMMPGGFPINAAQMGRGMPPMGGMVPNAMMYQRMPGGRPPMGFPFQNMMAPMGMMGGMPGMMGAMPMGPGGVPMMGAPMQRGPRGAPQGPASAGAQQQPSVAGISAAELSKMTPEEQKNALGERLYVKVSEINQENAAKITGMLLEMDTNEILNILEDPTSLNAKVSEAVNVLRDYQANP